jgi:hypothetical protein
MSRRIRVPRTIKPRDAANVNYETSRFPHLETRGFANSVKVADDPGTHDSAAAEG